MDVLIIKERVILEAERLLKNTDLTVSEIGSNLVLMINHISLNTLKNKCFVLRKHTVINISPEE